MDGSTWSFDSEPHDQFPPFVPDTFQNNGIFEFNIGLSNKDLFSNINKSANTTDFLSKFSNIYASKDLKTTRSGRLFHVPEADSIIQNPKMCNNAIFQNNSRVFSSLKTLKFLTVKTPSGKSKFEDWNNIETAALVEIGNEKITRSGRVYGANKYELPVGSPEETDFDETTIRQLSECVVSCMKRPIGKLEKKLDKKFSFKLDSSKGTTRPVSYQDSLNQEFGKSDNCIVKFEKSECNDLHNNFGQNDTHSQQYPNHGQNSYVFNDSDSQKPSKKLRYDNQSTLGQNDSSQFSQDDSVIKNFQNPADSMDDNRRYGFGQNSNLYNTDVNYNTDLTAGTFFVDNLTPGHDLNNILSNSNKKFKFSPKIKTETTKKKSKQTSEESKTFPCRIGDCQSEFDRNDLLKRHQKTHSTTKLFKCTECIYNCNRKDNLDNHMRIHFNAKPYICPYAMYKKDQNIWEPCRYAAARQDDLTKHCIGTAVCHLEKFSPADKKNHEKSGFPVPAKIMNSSKKTTNFKLRKGHVKLSEQLYREYVNQSEDFMYVVELKIMKKWTAIWNAAVKKKDETTKKMLRRKYIPNLMQGQNYDHMRHHVFDNPQFEFCDVILNLNSLDRRCLFGNYELGSKVEDKHVNPRIQAWSNEETHYWNNKVDFEIKHRLENNC